MVVLTNMSYAPLVSRILGLLHFFRILLIPESCSHNTTTTRYSGLYLYFSIYYWSINLMLSYNLLFSVWLSILSTLAFSIAVFSFFLVSTRPSQAAHAILLQNSESPSRAEEASRIMWVSLLTCFWSYLNPRTGGDDH